MNLIPALSSWYNTMFILKDTIESLSSASTQDLATLIKAAQKILDYRHLDDHLQYIPDIIDGDVCSDLLAECESLNLSSSSRRPESQWLSVTDRPYIYTDSKPVHHAKDITKLPAISRVMQSFNERFNCTMDSCLVLKYTSSSAGTSLHADDELTMDTNQPICNLSIGEPRTIDFLSNADGKVVRSFRMENRSLVLMKPGTQEVMTHRVPGETGQHVPSLRYSLSFRAMSKRPKPSLQNAAQAKGPEQSSVNAKSDTEIGSLAAPARHVCLIAGDSYAARLDTVKLGRKCVDVESVARGGARIHQVMEQIRDFKSNNKSVTVDKICISVGTNDIRYADSLDKIKLKFKSLCALIKELYPLSKVYFQSLIPLPCKSRHDWRTNSFVINMNSIIKNECIYRRFHILDAFRPLSLRYFDPRVPYIRDDRFFKAGDIHPSEAKGMGVLAKLYLRAIHSNFFDPFTLQ